MSQLDWMPVSESYDEADGALMPGLMVKHGAIARIGDGEVFMEVWPSELPEHIDDALTLTLTVDGDVHEEIGRYPSFEAARDAAQQYVDGRDGGLPGAR
ncbi:hypothetical protein [Mycobacterium sp. 1245852.3]|uniref:hypothetical protein n=1 Tax=Mycobacterium sp. 1245852.3 TaxID=1856860 RepID=UPI0007FE96AF|nr:hypothetical protein [Mycobacterium sp. 1245852.3]OBK19017.1 hypothetical protein A9W96_05960 [Mycobacterium sp. 1245852.3]